MSRRLEPEEKMYNRLSDVVSIIFTSGGDKESKVAMFNKAIAYLDNRKYLLGNQ